MKLRILTSSLIVVLLFVCGACSTSRATARRAGIVALGATAGGAAGSLYKEGGTAAIVGGAVLGGGLTQLALGDDEETLRAGFQRGYIQGQSDAIKRQYFLRHAKECEIPKGKNADGKTVYYLVPEARTPDDKNRLLVRIIE